MALDVHRHGQCGDVTARQLGLRVPRDVSIIGFDGIEEGELMQPSLATVGIPAHEIGRLAAQRMLSLLEGVEVPACTPMEHTILLRESLGKPKR